MNNSHHFHCPVPILVGEGKLILDSAAAHPEINSRLNPGFVNETTNIHADAKQQSSVQKQKRGQVGGLTREQLDKIAQLQHWKHEARKTAKLAFKGQTVKLHQQFQVGVHQPHDLQSQLGRARTILASVQSTENAAAIAAQGWTSAETTAFAAAIKAVEDDKTLLELAKDASAGATGTRDRTANGLYARLLTIQHAANLQWPESNPANAQIRSDFRIGKFPPKNHNHEEPVPSGAPSSAPAK